MKSIILFSIFSLSVFLLFGQTKKIKITGFPDKQKYIDVTFLTEGEKNSSKTISNVEIDFAYRIIITTSEIYDNLILEKMSYGSEGGNKKIISRVKVDLNNLCKEFNLKGEISGIEFIKWVTWNSFEFKVQNKRFLVKDVSPSSINVSEL